MPKWLCVCGLMVASTVIRVMLRIIPFSRVQPYLGQKMTQDLGQLSDEQRVYVVRLKDHLNTAVSYLPWSGNCLNHAILGKLLLRRKNIASTLHLGVRASASPARNPFAAHAWLTVGPEMICGDNGHSYQLLVCFS